MRAWLALVGTMLVVTMLVAAPAAKAQTVLYRCTDARGVVTLQNDTPCAKGSKQEKRVVEGVSAAPFPQPLPPPPSLTPVPDAPSSTGPALPPAAHAAQASAATASAVLPLPQPQTPPSDRLPPPPLYRCNTVQNDSYLSDTPEPKPRCVRMDTVGIDGSQQLGAGSACSMVYDQCQRVPDGAACDAWRQRVNEAQAAWTFARADTRDDAKAEYERIARIVAETTCNR